MKKRHLAIICGIYYPEPSPTGLCAKRFAELLKDDFDIDILCISVNGISERIRVDDVIEIHTLAGGTIGAEDKTKGLLKKIIHQFGRIQIKSQMLGNLKWFEKVALKKLVEINECKRIDSIFSICSPFVAHTAAKNYKLIDLDVHWCAYTVDPYSTTNRIRACYVSLKKLRTYEKKVLLKSDVLLLSEEVYNSRVDLHDRHRECNILPYMLPNDLWKPNDKISIFDKNNINCVYAGRFYDDIRNPEPMLKIFSGIDEERILLHLFSDGCEDIVDKYTSNHIIKHGLVSRDEIKNIYYDSDCLIVVLNVSDEFLPSKIFEYIVTGKPIIAFYINQRSKELDKYPLSLQIQTNNGKNMHKELLDFIYDMHGKTVESKQIEKIFENNCKDNVYHILNHSIQNKKIERSRVYEYF